MVTFLIIIHVIVCLALIGIVLLQGGSKGAEMGASFGAGGSQTVFGATGGRTLVQKLTTGAAVIFMLTSLILAYFHGIPGGDSVMPDSVAPAAAPVAPTAPATDK
ncbi:MAG: preprotein translocase subunit SecG [Desulfuromonas sp.]|nr:MAG: preprotein translocase subunit SecG [Desulfuromonas sp.]